MKNLTSEADPYRLTEQVRVALAQCHEDVDDAAIEQHEIEALRREVVKHEAPEESIERGAKHAIEKRIVALAPSRQHHLVTVGPFFDHLSNELGRVLQVRRNDRGTVARRKRQPGNQRRV